MYDDGGKRPEGDLLWTFPTGRMIRSAPALADGVLYFGSEDGTFYALDPATGSLLWDYAMPGGLSSGLQSSPAVMNGVAYVGSWDGSLYALDTSTGDLLWDYTTGDAVLSSPSVSGGMVYFGSRDHNFYALDASGGNILWNYTTGAEVVSSPAVANDIVYFGSYDKNLYALDTSTGTLLWNYTTGAEVRSSPAVADGVVYFGSEDRNLYALDASTGEFLWSYATGDSVYSSAAVANGVVYFGSYDENFYALDATTGNLLWSYATGDSVYSSPAVANGVVYFGNLWESFFALDASTGDLLWQYTLPEHMIFSSPAVAQGIVYVGMDDGNLYAFGSFPDEPPASVTDLHATSTQQLTITWAWTDPDQIGFSHVMVYLDGVFQANVTKGTETWTATGLSPSTAYTIGTRSAGEKGRINQTWVNNTATTGALSISSLDPPEVMVGSPAFTLNVYGTGFTSASTMLWNGEERPTQYLNSGHVRTDVPPELVARPRNVNITAFDSQSGEMSNPVYLIVTDAPSGDKAWKFRSDLRNAGIYDDGGTRPVGTLLWNFTTEGAVSSSPAVVDGVVYIGSQDSNLYAFNASSGAFLWKYNTTEPYDWVSSSPAVADGVVYIGGLKTKIHAIDAATGSPLWNYTVPVGYTARISVSSSPAVANGIVYVGSYDGNLYAVNSSNGMLLWNHTTAPGYNVFSSPAVVNGVVYFGTRDDNNIGNGVFYALDAVTGGELWSNVLGGSIDSSPSVVDGIVYVGCSDHNIYAFDASSGMPHWNYTTGGTVYSSPAVADGVVYFGSYDNNTYALDAATGAVRWKYTTGGNVPSSPAVANGVVYIGSYDNKIYALDALDGSLLWSYTTGNIVRSSPAVANGVVYFGSYDRGVYAVGTTPGLPPVANFTANETLGFVPLTVQFIDSSTGSPPLAYQWDFGDGSQNATVQNPVHAYTARGTYNVTLTVSNGAGTHSFERPWYIHAMDSLPPIGGDKAYYLVHSNVDGAEVYFNGDSFEGTIGNGTLLVQTCTSCTPVWTYTVKKCGYFTLTQNNTRYPAKDEVVDLYANLTAPKEPLIADFTANITEGTAPLTVGFESHSVGIAQTWNWSFGDGTYSEEEDPVHTYTAPGIYTVSLHETNSACQDNTMVKPEYIRVGGTPLFKADFTVSPVTGDAPLTVRCTDTSIGDPTMIVYNFGDGFTSVGSDVIHTYRFPGTYTISQTISKYDRATRSFLISVARKPDAVTVFRAITPPPEAAFTASPLIGAAPLTVTFTDESTGTPTYYSYDFGDGFKATGKNPVHTYRSPGTYVVKLTVLRINSDFASLQSSVATGTIVVNEA